MWQRRYRGQGGGGGGLTLPSYPEPVSNLTAVQLDVDRITLNWDVANVPADVTNLLVYQNGNVVANLATNATTANIANLTAGNTYTFDVVADTATGPIAVGDSLTFTPQYMYGYPYANTRTAEPNVAMQFVMHEASANIIDGVAGLQLEPVVGAAGAVIYNVAGTDYSPLMKPQIYVASGSTGQAAYFKKENVNTLAFGTNSAVFEWVAAYPSSIELQSISGGVATIFSTVNDSIEQGIYLYMYNFAKGQTPRLNLLLRASDGTLFNSYISFPETAFGSGPHKHRVVINRAGNFSYFIDGASQGSPLSLSTLEGKTIACSQVVFCGARLTAVNRGNGRFFEVRLTIGNATNNSGGPNGG